MFKCVECGNIFEDGEQWTECRGEHFGFPCAEEMSGCPVCGEAYYEVYPCKICGCYEHMTEDSHYCKECENDVKERFQKLLSEEFTKEERTLLNEMYDGEEM